MRLRYCHQGQICMLPQLCHGITRLLPIVFRNLAASRGNCIPEGWIMSHDSTTSPARFTMDVNVDDKSRQQRQRSLEECKGAACRVEKSYSMSRKAGRSEPGRKPSLKWERLWCNNERTVPSRYQDFIDSLPPPSWGSLDWKDMLPPPSWRPV